MNCWPPGESKGRWREWHVWPMCTHPDVGPVYPCLHHRRWQCRDQQHTGAATLYHTGMVPAHTQQTVQQSNLNAPPQVCRWAVYLGKLILQTYKLPTYRQASRTQPSTHTGQLARVCCTCVVEPRSGSSMTDLWWVRYQSFRRFLRWATADTGSSCFGLAQFCLSFRISGSPDRCCRGKLISSNALLEAHRESKLHPISQHFVGTFLHININ